MTGLAYERLCQPDTEWEQGWRQRHMQLSSSGFLLVPTLAAV